MGPGASTTLYDRHQGPYVRQLRLEQSGSDCDPLYDGEGIMFDTLETHISNGIWIAKNNVLWNNDRYGIHFFWQCKTTNPFTVNLDQQHGNFAEQRLAWSDWNIQDAGEINVASSVSCEGFNVPVSVNIKNNIAKITIAEFSQRCHRVNRLIYAFVLGTRNTRVATHWPSLVLGGAGSECLQGTAKNRLR